MKLLNAPIGAAMPTVPLTSPRFNYVPQAKTDVTATWRRFGWLPSFQQRGNNHVKNA